MDAQGAASVSDHASSYTHPTSSRRGGRGRDGGGGYRNSGSFQRWLPTESGGSSSSAAAKIGQGHEANGKLDASHEARFIGGSPSVSREGFNSSSSTRISNRASFKVYSDEPRPNHASRASATGMSSSDRAVSKIHGTRKIGSNASAAKESRFVAYLPQDDAVVEGLGEQEGGVDASQTQEVTDLLNEQLSALLRLPPRQFWERVATDESLGIFLDSYLHFRRRWFDNPIGSVGGSKVSVVAGDDDLSRRTFMVLLRMSSTHDPGTPASESLSAKEHAVILQEKKLLDIPKLMDISAIYGRDNADLTSRLVSNVFKSQPINYGGELAAYIPPLLERIITMHQRCCVTIQAIKHPRDSGITAVSWNCVQQELLEVVDYLNDVAVTLKAFVKAYPPAAVTLVSAGNPTSGQGLFLTALATIHDSLLPILQEGFTTLNGSAGSQQLYDTSEMNCPPNLVVGAQDQLHKLGQRLVDLSWHLIEFQYLGALSGDHRGMNGAVYTSNSYEDAVWKGDSLFQAVISLAMGPSEDDDDIAGEFGYMHRLVCTGDLLESLEKHHGLFYHIIQARQTGAVVLDDSQHEYLAALIVGKKSPNVGQYNPPSMSAENFPQLTLPEKELEEESVIQQSKISQIKDLFPDYGDGFILACLEAYDNDPEKVIERILEGTLHSDLLSLDTSLVRKPSKMAQTITDKGKGKVTEQPLLNKGKSIWEEKSSTKGSGSSSLAGGSGVIIEHSEEKLLIEPLIDPGVKVGRYMRRQKGDGDFTHLLDSRNGNEELRAVIKAAASQIEYEDEYDDSFDELGGYVADAGGNEETESLADQVGHRVGSRDEHVNLKNNRPVALTPWGHTNTSTKGRGRSTGAPRSGFEPRKLSTVVLEVEGQVDAPADFTAGQGRGARGGRGRRKWKEQGPRPEFYLKEGKLYSYKVAGAVGVSSVEEAELMKQEQSETIHGLRAGGNIPVQQQDTSGSWRRSDGSENSSKVDQPDILGDGGRHYPGNVGDSGRGGGGNNRGRGFPGRGSHGRNQNDNHRRKDQAMKKNFGGL